MPSTNNNYHPRGRGGRGSGRGGRGGRGRGGRFGGRGKSHGHRSSGSNASRIKRSDNLKDPVNYYTLGSTPGHLAEQMKITQTIIQHIQKTQKISSDLVKALTSREPVKMDGPDTNDLKAPSNALAGRINNI